MRHELGLYTALQVCVVTGHQAHTLCTVFTQLTHTNTHTHSLVKDLQAGFFFCSFFKFVNTKCKLYIF